MHPLRLLIYSSLIIPPNRRPKAPPKSPPPARLLRLSIIPPIMPQLRRNPRPHRRTPQTRLTRRTPLINANLIVPLQPIIPAMHRRRPQSVIPAIPARSRDHRRRRVPARVTDDRLPRPRAAVVVVAVGEALVGGRAGIHCRGLDVYLGAGRAVEVPDVDAAVVRAGVDVALVGGGGRGEVAADEGFEDAVAAEGYEGAVVGVRGVVQDVVGGEAVVEVCGVVLKRYC